MKHLELINWLTPTEALQYISWKLDTTLSTSFLYQFMLERGIPLHLRSLGLHVHEYSARGDNPWTFVGLMDGQNVFESGAIRSTQPSPREHTPEVYNELNTIFQDLVSRQYLIKDYPDWVSFTKSKIELESNLRTLEILDTSRTATINNKRIRATPFGTRETGSFSNITNQWKQQHWLCPQESRLSSNSYYGLMSTLKDRASISYSDLTDTWLIPISSHSDEEKLSELQNIETLSYVESIWNEEVFNQVDAETEIHVSIYRKHLESALSGNEITRGSNGLTEPKGKAKSTFEKTLLGLTDYILSGRTENHFKDATSIEIAVNSKGFELGCSKEWLAQVLKPHAPQKK